MSDRSDISFIVRPEDVQALTDHLEKMRACGWDDEYVLDENPDVVELHAKDIRGVEITEWTPAGVPFLAIVSGGSDGGYGPFTMAFDGVEMATISCAEDGELTIPLNPWDTDGPDLDAYRDPLRIYRKAWVTIYRRMPRPDISLEDYEQ